MQNHGLHRHAQLRCYCPCRCENLKLPSMGEEGYIKEDGELKGHLQAQEHRSVMQLMPCVVLAAAHDAFVGNEAAAAGLKLVELVFR